MIPLPEDLHICHGTFTACGRAPRAGPSSSSPSPPLHPWLSGASSLEIFPLYLSDSADQLASSLKNSQACCLRHLHPLVLCCFHPKMTTDCPEIHSAETTRCPPRCPPHVCCPQKRVWNHPSTVQLLRRHWFCCSSTEQSLTRHLVGRFLGSHQWSSGASWASPYSSLAA